MTTAIILLALTVLFAILYVIDAFKKNMPSKVRYSIQVAMVSILGVIIGISVVKGLILLFNF